MNKNVLFSSDKKNWETPQKFFDALNGVDAVLITPTPMRLSQNCVMDIVPMQVTYATKKANIIAVNILSGAARRRTPMSIELYGKALQKGLAEIQPGVLHIREETNRFSPKLLEETAGGGMPTVSRGIEAFLNYLRDTEQQLHMAEQTEQEANDATQDILHWFELYNFRGIEAVKMAHKLREIRHQRREAKDVVWLTSPVVDWIQRHRAEIKELERLLGEVRKRERRTENRIYTPKTRIMEGTL